MSRVPSGLLALLATCLWPTLCLAQVSVQPPRPDVFIKADEHIKHLEVAKFEHYRDLAGAKVSSEAEFNKMKSHLHSVYKNAKIEHTFIGHGGNHIDCIQFDHQPGARAEVARGHKLHHTAPDLHQQPLFGDDKKHPTTAKGVPYQLKKGMKDPFGNEMFCPDGSVPMRRVTLTQMTRFHSFNDFFQKHHGGSNHPRLKPTVIPPDTASAAPSIHRYAHAYQEVSNYGGSSWLNLWDPAPTLHQFSLSQQWYTGGSPIQTLEGGWQVYPDLYGHSKPVLFIYWTADGYNKTGAYNLSKPGFIQVNNSFVIGGAWSAYSTTDGTQFGFRMTWYRDPANGNWWLYLTGAGKETAIGYYPRSLYGTGQMSKFATEIDYGGEVTGQTASGKMGSGDFAKAGWKHAAFHKEIYYFPNTGKSAWAKLTPSETNKAYYTIDVHNNTGSNWGTYFYFGGPGGK